MQKREPDIDSFARRHIGPNEEEVRAMLRAVGFDRLDALIDATVPKDIRLKQQLSLPEGKSESEALAELRTIANQNKLARSFIGAGYHDCMTPPVIQRNILENPGWYTAYTPYQAEIAQGRLEALLNFQQMILDLTALDIANASMLDESTAAAEAMALCHAAVPNRKTFFVADNCHPQTIAVVQTRAKPLGIEIKIGDYSAFNFDSTVFGALVQYPATDGAIYDYTDFVRKAHDAGALVVAAADILALTLLKPPGEFGADVAVGNTQRFGVPLGFGGPHAAFFATRDEFKRQMPGRLVGISKDPAGRPGYRLSLQTREQHIRRDKATSNICTAQVLLAVIAATYAVYHGPHRLRKIAERIRLQTEILTVALKRFGFDVSEGPRFDTLRVNLGDRRAAILAKANAEAINVRMYPDGSIGLALDETVSDQDLSTLIGLFGDPRFLSVEELCSARDSTIPGKFVRRSAYLTHPVFNSYHTETELSRYLHRLVSRDLSLTTSMIPLGSCTMKLNAAAEMLPITWPEFSQIHPFAPKTQIAGYLELIAELEADLAEITGFDAVTIQPNAGSQGEYAGLLVIREYFRHRSETHRDVCLIPTSAHGTNPASAAMAGLKVVPVQCDAKGNIDIADLRSKAERHAASLAALMVTYPSTHGVFEEDISEICDIIHSHGGQVYMDGANLNALVGLCRPGDFGADVCHLNLHKTFCIPHGGGGPGMGPICVAAHLAPFLPGHPAVKVGGAQGTGPISAAPWGSASILVISYAYIRMMGAAGLTRATEVAILAANYIATRLEDHFPVLYRGGRGRVAHECILDLRALKRSAGIEVDDVAKRLIDYGFHAPTVSFPVAGTVMVEPTESESKAELDRFCDAMISIRKEIAEVEAGRQPREGNVLKSSPHTAEVVTADGWDRPYSRQLGAFPSAFVRASKFWPAVGRLNNVLGDRKLICSCPPTEDYA